jgi:S-adenosylmethionine synthetase
MYKSCIYRFYTLLPQFQHISHPPYPGRLLYHPSGKRLPAVSLVPYLDALTIADPTAIMVNTFGTGKMKDMDIVGLAHKHFDPTSKCIIETLDLKRPIFRKTAAYGHFGRNDPDFTWERTDVAEDIAKSAGI